MILVNAANGQQGKRLIPKLIAAGMTVRGCVRSEGSATELRAAGVADVVVGDLADPAVIARAVRGVDTIYHVCPGIHPREREIGMAWIDAARAEGVRHFVFSSVIHAILTDLVQHEIKRDIEEYLLSSGLEYTILQPTIYMAPRRFKLAIDNGVLTTGWSLDRHQSLVDLGDVADAAFTVLTGGDAHFGATYELSGAERLTARDMGAIMSHLCDRAIRVDEVGANAYLEALFGKQEGGVPPHAASVVRSLNNRYSSHDFIGNANVLTWLIGRRPTSFAEFIASYLPVVKEYNR